MTSPIRSVTEDPALVSSIKSAITRYRATASPEEVAFLERIIDLAHAQALAVLRGTRAAPLDYPELSWVKTALGEAAVPLGLPSWTTIVDAEGALVGFERYEQLDYRWAETVVKYAEYLHKPKPPFGAEPQVLTMPERTTLAIAGDWGTGFWEGTRTGAQRVGNQMKSADYTIHIGDTYYAGTGPETSDNLAGPWPRGKVASLAIPGNHEMYCNGEFYWACLPEAFPEQGQTSFFAMQNADWLILALDTAYYASNFYLNGSLGPTGSPQYLFTLERLGNKGDRKVMLITHHQPVQLGGTELTGLCGEVRQLFRAGGVPDGPDYWYWGHLHNAVVYQDAVVQCHGRCVGHGAIPFGVASELKNNPNVAWFETTSARDADYPKRVLNGFLHLDLDGPNAREALYGEDGSLRWSDPAQSEGDPG